MKKLKSKHKIVAAIIQNELVFCEVSHEEIHEPIGDFGESPAHFIVCGSKKKNSLKLILPYETVIFLDQNIYFPNEKN
jgi:hypothetical protein